MVDPFGDDSKIALVTGSSSGIGLATVKQLADRGYRVAIVGTNKEKVDQAAEECRLASPHKFEPLKLVLDFSDPDNGEKAVEETVKHFGQLDVLVNNAGIFVKTPGFEPKSYDLYRQAMTINTDATVKCTLAAVEHLKKTKGRIVFVSSVASIKPSSYGYAYCMSKAAMSAFAKSLAIDIAPDVRVNIVSPGPVLTPIFSRIGLNQEQARAIMDVTTLQNRIGLPEEIANAIVFLISEQATFINGHELFIDGGYLIKPSNYPAMQEALDNIVNQ